MSRIRSLLIDDIAFEITSFRVRVKKCSLKMFQISGFVATNLIFPRIIELKFNANSALFLCDFFY